MVDEAFMDAVPGEPEALASRTDVPGLVVLRSLTKTWGLAGLRIGHVLAAPETIAELERAQPLWPGVHARTGGGGGVHDAPGLRCVPACAVWASLRGDTFPGLNRHWLRLAVRDRTTTNRFLQALDQALTMVGGGV